MPKRGTAGLGGLYGALRCRCRPSRARPSNKLFSQRVCQRSTLVQIRHMLRRIGVLLWLDRSLLGYSWRIAPGSNGTVVSVLSVGVAQHSLAFCTCLARVSALRM